MNEMPRLDLRKRFQVTVDDNTLGKLRHVDPLQEFVKVRLAGKDDLQLQRVPVVQIGQQPQFFEQIRTKALGFIDDQNDPPVLLGFMNQKFRKDIVGLDRVQLSFAQPEGKQHPGKEMLNVVARVGDKTDRM